MRKKRTLFALSLLSLSLLLSACAPAQPAPSASPAAVTEPTPAASPKAAYQKLTAQEAKARIDSGDKLSIVDVREDFEFAGGHIPGAVLLPAGQIIEKAAELLPDKDAEILLYCRSGNRSRQAALQMINQYRQNNGLRPLMLDPVLGSIAQAQALELPVVEFLATHGRCPRNGDAGFGSPDTHAYAALAAVDFGQFEGSGRCGLEATLHLPGSPALDGKSIWLEYDSDADRWTCTSDVDDRHLPVDCRG